MRPDPVARVSETLSETLQLVFLGPNRPQIDGLAGPGRTFTATVRRTTYRRADECTPADNDPHDGRRTQSRPTDLILQTSSDITVTGFQSKMLAKKPTGKEHHGPNISSAL
jgi:hypothetical protein